MLAPIPNVVATTDIALITGYALGAAARLRGRRAGGADLQHLARPGPVDSVADGGLGPGRPRRRLAGRASPAAASVVSGLATACALAGFAYGALLDLSVMVTYGGEQSLDRYLALSARGIPFNVAHAAGNFAIALAAGPALVRMISRYRTRLEFTWQPAGALPLACWRCVGAWRAGPGRVGAEPRRRGRRASRPAFAGWRATQNSDGGFGATPEYSRRARR